MKTLIGSIASTIGDSAERTPVIRRLGVALEDAAGGVLVIALAAAPWMYGSTRHWAIVELCRLLSLVAACWLGGLLVQLRKPRVPDTLILIAVFVLVCGWATVLGRPEPPTDSFTSSHFAMLYQREPASFMIKTPLETMWLYSGLLMALIVTGDLFADRHWRTVIIGTMALTGLSIVVLGIVQIKTGATHILWNNELAATGFFFATFFHHSSAGAFINVTWPLAAAFFIYRLCQAGRSDTGGRLELLFWAIVLLAMFCGLAMQVSRFAQVNGLIMLLSYSAWLLWRSWLQKRSRFVTAVVIGGLLFAFAGVGLVSATKNSLRVTERWQLLLAREPERNPNPVQSGFQMHPNGFLETTNPAAGKFMGVQRLVAATCFRMIPQAGLLGFGPGRWMSAYPHFTNDELLRTFYLHMQFAHNDYLQTWVEWGLLGAIAWGFLVWHAMRSGVRLLRSAMGRSRAMSRDEAIVLGAVMSLAGVLLHAATDFPLQIPAIQLYVCVLLGSLWAGRQRVRAVR